MKYIIVSEGLQSEEMPVLRVEADGMQAVPTSVEPYDPDDETLVIMASRLRESIDDHPEYNTLAMIAVSFGGLTDENGKEIE